MIKSPEEMRKASVAQNKAIRLTQTTEGIGSQPSTKVEVDKAPKPSPKGSARRKREGK